MSKRHLAVEPWKKVSSKPIYQNRWLSLREDLVELPDGKTTIYGVVTCGDCVGILPFVDRDRVLLIQQYRYVAGRTTWEMPTGGMHPGESFKEAAQRELEEEAGYRAGRLTKIVSYHTSKSVLDETAHLYLAEELQPVHNQPADDTEFIKAQVFPFTTLIRMAMDGQILDSMTIIAALHVARLRGL
ncbi:MAG: NUDIX hydrolase [Candidatus Methylomirabilis oxyfera]|nr:NUDIX hydrolase [Candidatus Methylomirabilis oxyfera]